MVNLQNIDLKTDKILANIFPKKADWEYEELRNDIELNGVKVPLEISDDGTLIDGHRRFNICLELGVPLEDIPVNVKHYGSESEKLEAAIKFNLLRRHLNLATRALIAVEYFLPMERESALQRMLSGRGAPRKISDEGGRAYHLAGKRVGVSEDTLRKVEYVLKHGAQKIVMSLLDGKLSINKAYKKVKAEEEFKKSACVDLQEELSKNNMDYSKAVMISSLPKNIQGDIIKKIKDEDFSDEETERLIDDIKMEPEMYIDILSLPKKDFTALPKDVDIKDQGPEKEFFEEGACPVCGAMYVLDRVNVHVDWRKISRDSV